MFQFPASPVLNQEYNPATGIKFRWNGTAWYLVAGPNAFLTQTEGDLRYMQLSNLSKLGNRIINGKFAIDQRMVGLVKIVNNAATNYGLDRWHGQGTAAAGVFQFGRELDGVLAEYRMAVQVTTADAVIDSGDEYTMRHAIEGYNVADLFLGTSIAKPFVFAFEIESNIAGTFAVAFRNGAATRSYVTSFTIPTANVRQTVVLQIPGDTGGGLWQITNSTGLIIFLTLAMGSTGQASVANTWLNGNFKGLAGMTNFMATVGNRWRITNARLYPGTIDYGPDVRLYADELPLCQRYYWKTFSQDTAPSSAPATGVTGAIVFTAINPTTFHQVGFRYPVQMRSAPTITTYNPVSANAQARDFASNVDFTSTAPHGAPGDSGSHFACQSPAGSIQGNGVALHLACDAEIF